MWLVFARWWLEAVVNTNPDCMQGLAQTTIMKAHRLLSAPLCFVFPAGLSFCLGLFMPAMNSSSVDADMRIFTGSKSSTSKLTGSSPCTVRPKHVWDYETHRAQTLRCAWKLPTCIICKQPEPHILFWQHQSQLDMSHRIALCFAIDSHVQAQLTKPNNCDMWCAECAVFIPERSLPHQQLWQPLLHPCILQGILASHVLINVLGISHSSAWRCGWTFNTMGCHTACVKEVPI